MLKPIVQISRRKAALLAGWGLLFMTLFALYAVYFIFPDFIIPDDAELTVQNITQREFQFRLGICSHLMVIILDVLVAWALYVFLKPVNNTISLLTAWFRLIYSGIYAVSLANYFKVLELINGMGYQNVFGNDQLNTQIMLFLKTFDDTWAIGLVLFGFHITFLGYLTFKSGYVPKVLGILMIVAGASYVIDYFSLFLFPENPLPLSTYLGWGELIFMLWLLFKGGKTLRNETE